MGTHLDFVRQVTTIGEIGSGKESDTMSFCIWSPLEKLLFWIFLDGDGGISTWKFRGFGMVEEVPRPDMILSPLENGIPSKMERERGKKKDNISLSYQFDVIT